MNKIYLLEDEDEDFRYYSNYLKENNFIVLPSTEVDRQRDLKLVIDFVANYTNESFNALNQIFESYDIDLFLLDLTLDRGQEKIGAKFNENFLMKNSKLSSLPVIYLTIIYPDNIKLYKNTHYVKKNPVAKELTSTNLLNRINGIINKKEDFFDKILKLL